jgi:hypothetical protein
MGGLCDRHGEGKKWAGYVPGMEKARNGQVMWQAWRRQEIYTAVTTRYGYLTVKGRSVETWPRRKLSVVLPPYQKLGKGYRVVPAG